MNRVIQGSFIVGGVAGVRALAGRIAPRVSHAHHPHGPVSAVQTRTLRGPAARFATPLPPEAEARLGRGAGRPLPQEVRAHMESVFQADFSAVRVHVGPEASSLGALAFTMGSDIFFAPGRADWTRPQGRRLLAHELTHVVQQRTGRVRNPYGNGTAVVQDPGLEAEAERMSLRAMTARRPAVGSASPPIQRFPGSPRPGRALQGYFLVMEDDNLHLEDLTSIAKSTKEGLGSMTNIQSLYGVKDKSLTILGHGSSRKNTLGGYDPYRLAKKLKSLGISGSTIQVVELLGCHVGERPEGMPLSYATQLEIELSDQVGQAYTVKILPSLNVGGDTYRLLRSQGSTGMFRLVDFGSKKNYQSYKVLRQELGAQQADLWMETKLKYTDYSPSQIRDALEAPRTSEESSGWRYTPVSKRKGYGTQSPFHKEDTGCFLTTACTTSLGLADDCRELQTLRWFRDDVLIKIPEGRAAVERYYALAPGLVDRLAARRDADGCFAAMYRTLVLPTVSAVLAGDFAAAWRIYHDEALRWEAASRCDA